MYIYNVWVRIYTLGDRFEPLNYASNPSGKSERKKNRHIEVCLMMRCTKKKKKYVWQHIVKFYDEYHVLYTLYK